MKETLSVDDAIKKGIYGVNLPALLIFIVGLIASFVMAFIFFLPYGMIAGLMVSYVLATAYRAIMAAKWRNWAFERVRNVHKLHERALAEKLLFLKNRPGFGIINYNSAIQQQKWAKLQTKFQQPDVFMDDQSVPAETIIRYSVFKYVVWATVFLLMTLLGIYFCTLGQLITYPTGIPLIIIGAVNTYLKIKNMLNRAPQIILNNDGIRTADTPFYTWNEVANEKTIREGSGKYAVYYLYYEHKNGSHKFELKDLELNFMGIQKLMKLYRGRNESV